MGPVIGVILREICEVFQSLAGGFLHAQASVLIQQSVHIGGRGLVPWAVRQFTAIDQGVFFGTGTGDAVKCAAVGDAAVEQLIEVDVLRPLIERNQGLIADICAGDVVIEKFLIEIRQLVAGEGAGLR